MLIYAGIDEAGYGPLIGPLCVACSEWSIDGLDDPLAVPDLWKLLSRAVCRSGSDRRARVAFNDSKKLKGTGTVAGVHPMATIERGVLSALALQSDVGPISTDRDLFERVARTTSSDLSTNAPWYGGETELPWACDRAQVGIACAMLRKAATDARVAGHGVACDSVDAEEINDAARRGMVKTSVPWTVLINHVARLRTRWPDSPIRVAADRQSGRMRYVDDLLRAFPEDRLAIVREDASQSVYELRGARPTLAISFTVKGELEHLPIALASMTAKYVRELWMERLNRWFAQRVTNLAPTAGYVKDGRRFVGLIRPALQAAGLAESKLVRAI